MNSSTASAVLRVVLIALTVAALGSCASTRQKRALESIADASPAVSKRAFDSLASSGFGAFDKRAFDSLAGQGFGAFNKRAFDSLSGLGLTPFNKRAFDSLAGNGFVAFDKRSFHRSDDDSDTYGRQSHLHLL